MNDSVPWKAHASPRVQPFAAYPLAPLAVAFALGILAGLCLTILISLLIACAAAFTLAALVALLVNRTNSAIALVICAMFLVGATVASIEKQKVPTNQLKRLLTASRMSSDPGAEFHPASVGELKIAIGEPVEITGVLERDPEVAPDRWYLNLKVERVRQRAVENEVVGEVLLVAPVKNSELEREFLKLDLHYGARIRVMTALERSDNFRNPGVSSFTEYLDRKGYDATGFVRSPLLVERLENEPVFLPLAWLYRWRGKLEAEIVARFDRDTAGVIDAAMLGNRYNLSGPTSARFREGGTFHVLVISGLHITFLGGLVFLVAKRLTRNRLAQFLLPVTILWSYSLAVGAEASVLRAALMFTVVLLAPLLWRRASSLNVLSGVGIALLLWRPSDLLDPSFQLTFGSVSAIVLLAWPILQKLAAIGSWRPARATPYPPACASWLRTLCEVLYWSELGWQRELERTNYNYRLFKAPLAATLERLHLQRLLRYCFGAVVVSAVVQLVLLPFFIIYFHRLSLASFLLNIGVSVLMGSVAAVAAVGLLLAQVSGALAGPFIKAANALNSLMVHSVDPFARVGLASIRLPEYSGWASAIYALYYVPLTVLVWCLWRWHPLQLLRPDSGLANTARIRGGALLAQATVILAVIFHPWSEAQPEGRLRVDFLDVGQGDSALVTFPDNTTLLIDGGGQPGPFKTDNWTADLGKNGDEMFERDSRRIGESVVSEYLWWRGLDHIDYLLATHADADHIDGLNDVATNFRVRAALVARTPDRDPEYSKFSPTLAEKGIPLRVIGAGDELMVGEVVVSVLWPSSATDQNLASGNNDSVVLSLRFGKRSILLTGDIEAPAENSLVAKSRESLRADLVKVPHHGSRTSSTEAFTAATHPRFAVISVGRTSIFGHPNPAVVERWNAVGSRVWTTGKMGTITVRTDGKDLEITSFIAESAEDKSWD
jgi:competence protein ComEC